MLLYNMHKLNFISNEYYNEILERYKEEKAYLDAININPNNGVYRNDLGNIFYESGDYQRAAERYAEATKINPEVETYTSNLILACEQLEDLDNAIFLLELALKYNPDKIELTQAIERLKKRLKNQIDQ